MGRSVRVLFSFVILMWIGFVSADQKSGGVHSHRQRGESVVTRPSCPFTENTEAKTRKLLNSQVNSCFMSPNGTDFMEGLHNAETTNDVRVFFRRFCGMKTFARQCAASITAISELCLNVTQRTAVRIHANFIQLSYEIGCAQGGDKAANAIVNGWQLKNGSLDGVVYGCVRAASNQLVLRGATDVTVVSMQHYRMLKALKECIVSAEPQGSAMANFADVIMGDILKALPCFDQYRVEVLCETIDI